jgi:hypothetical protein
LALPLTASALCAIFLAILIGGTAFHGSSCGRRRASGDSGGGARDHRLRRERDPASKTL